MPADTNKDSQLSVEELVDYTGREVSRKKASQSVQSYAANTSEVLFWR